MNNLLGDWRREGYCGEVSEAMVGRSVTLMGWVSRTRNLGGLIFVWLRDYKGVVQLVFDEAVCGRDVFEMGEGLRGEYVLAVRGQVRARGADAVNEKLATGRVEVFVTDMKLLNKAETPPIYIDDDHPDESEAVRLKYRYLDIRRPSLQESLRLRAKVVSTIRRHFDDSGFTEVETPILSKSTPEGARDFLVPSRVHPGLFYALPQSPQIYKQLLMLGGMDRYYQIARCFRDEDNRADRQPEFTQLDLEMSFVSDPLQIQEVVTGAFRQVFDKVLHVALPDPLPRITWQHAMDTYGSDKPDRRFGLHIVDVTNVAKGCGFSVFEGAAMVRGINASGLSAHMTRKEIDALTEYVKTYRAKGLAWMSVEEGGVRSSFGKFLKEGAQDALVQALGAKIGDTLFFVADKASVVLQSLGALRCEIARRCGLIDESVYDLFWVTEFPLLEWDEEENRFQAMHHPFTSPMDEDIGLMESDPGRCRAKAYDLVLNGIEMGSGSIRIHSSELQERMFNLLGFSHEQAWKRFGFMLEAFRYGTPPHGGFAFGVDRMVMQILRKTSLRDVLAFPKIANASCLMMNTPSDVDKAQMDLLHLQHFGL